MKKQKISKSAKSIDYINITLSFRKDVYDELKVMARAEYRSVQNQIKYLMAIGKDLIANSNGALITRPSETEKENEQLESAIGFKVGE